MFIASLGDDAVAATKLSKLSKIPQEEMLLFSSV